MKNLEQVMEEYRIIDDDKYKLMQMFQRKPYDIIIVWKQALEFISLCIVHFVDIVMVHPLTTQVRRNGQ